MLEPSDVAVAPWPGRSGALAKLKPGPGRPAADVADHQRARIQQATIEIVAERGYEAVTVREIARLAGVSTKAFYQNFASKEQAFRDTLEEIARGLCGHLAAQGHLEVASRRDRMRQVIQTVIDELAGDPRAASLILIESHVAGPDTMQRLRLVDRSIKDSIAQSLGLEHDENQPSSRVVDGIVSGLLSLVRSRLLAGREREIPQLVDPLTLWAVSYVDSASPRLREIDRAISPSVQNGDTSGDREWTTGRVEAPPGNLALLLSATAKLTASNGLHGLEVRHILAAAGVRRRAFYSNFASAEDCFVATLELQMKRVLAHVSGAREVGNGLAENTYQAVSSLCDQIAQDQVLANFCFGDLSLSGRKAMRCRERFLTDLGSSIGGGDSKTVSDEVFGEASASALWNVIHNEVMAGRANQLPRVAGTLAYLVLAPSMGASAAIEALCKVHPMASSQS